jgi:hypothetical protein
MQIMYQLVVKPFFAPLYLAHEYLQHSIKKPVHLTPQVEIVSGWLNEIFHDQVSNIFVANKSWHNGCWDLVFIPLTSYLLFQTNLMKDEEKTNKEIFFNNNNVRKIKYDYALFAIEQSTCNQL